MDRTRFALLAVYLYIMYTNALAIWIKYANKAHWNWKSVHFSHVKQFKQLYVTLSSHDLINLCLINILETKTLLINFFAKFSNVCQFNKNESRKKRPKILFNLVQFCVKMSKRLAHTHTQLILFRVHLPHWKWKVKLTTLHCGILYSILCSILIILAN